MMKLPSFLLNLRYKLANLRTFERKPHDHTAVLSTVEVIGDASSIETRCKDSSVGGLGIVSPVPLKFGTLVRIDMRGEVLYAEVRRCTKVNKSYSIGLQITRRPDVMTIAGLSKMDLDVAGMNW